MDAAAIDAIVREDGRFLAPDSSFTSFSAHVQLKATCKPLTDSDGCLPFSLPLKQYDRLRETKVHSQRVLVVLQLPPNPKDWLRHTEDACVQTVRLLGQPARGARERE